MTAISPVSHKGPKHREALIDTHPPDPRLHLPVRPIGNRIEGGGHQFHLAVRIEVGEIHDRGPGHRIARAKQALGQVLQPFSDVRSVATYLFTTVRQVYSL